jgi:hypothetical protein
MIIENYVAIMTQEEYDALPQKMPEYKKGSMWLEPSHLTALYEAKGLKVDHLFLHVLEGEEAPCRAHGCNCYVGDLMTHVYRVEICKN